MTDPCATFQEPDAQSFLPLVDAEMATPDIVAKLQKLLADHPLTEESQVVYLLVESRKLLQRQNEEGRYPFLKFYADWAVHSEKDHVTSAMKEIIADIATAATYEVQEQHNDVGVQQPIREFALMGNLRTDMQGFLDAYGLADQTTGNDTSWRFFVELLVGVLEDQPIRPEKGAVRSVTFIKARPGCLTIRIEFVAPVRGETHYDYQEAY